MKSDRAGGALMAMGPISSRSGNRRRAPMADINVTPLVDVMLVLLIIFMVTAPLLTAGVDVKLPDSRAGAIAQDQKPIAISLDKTGAVFIGDEPVSPTALPARLAGIAARPAGEEPPQIFLRADEGLDYGRVMQVMGEISHAGLSRVSLITVGGDNAGADAGTGSR